MRRRAAAAAVLLLLAAWTTGTAEAADVKRSAESPVKELQGLRGRLKGGLDNTGIALGLPITLNADRMTYDDTTGMAEAEGNVEAGFGNRTIRADRIRYDTRTGEAEFNGHVHYKDEGDEFSFDRIVIDIDDETGILYNGTIHLSSGNYQITSKMFEKTGPRDFRLEDGSLTTCPCDPEPDWKFEVGKSRIRLEGYAVGRNITFRIRGVPVLWLPWGAFPVKLKRQSGLLLPNFQHSRTKGYALTVPLYWAVNRWSDATLSLESMTRRGLRPEAEYRFVLNPLSEGAIRFSAFHDRALADDRFRAYGENLFQYKDDWTLNGAWDIVSDDAYYVDLADPEILRTARAVPSRGFGAVRGTGISEALGVTWIQDHQGTPDDNTVQRLPQYDATVLPRTIGGTGIDAGGHAQATYFYRQEGWRELRGRGFAEVDVPLRIHPSLVLTPFLTVDALGSSSWFSDGSTPWTGSRVVPGAGAVAAVDLRRDFATRSGTRLVHTVQAQAGFRWIPDVDQSDLPVTDLWSRIAPQDQLAFGLSQRILRIRDAGGPSEVAVLELEWAYDLANLTRPATPYVDPLDPYVRTLRDQIDVLTGRSSTGRNAASDLLARLRLVPAPRWKLGGEVLFDPSSGDFSMASAGGSWTRSKENFVLAEYRTTRELAQDVRGAASFRLFRILGLKTDASYSLRENKIKNSSSTLTLHPRSDCWSVGFQVDRKTRPDETSFKVLFGLKGIGDFGG